MTKRAPTVTVNGVQISRKKTTNQLTPFARLVYAYTKRIPKGRTISKIATPTHLNLATHTYTSHCLASFACVCVVCVLSGRVSTYKLIAASIGHPKAFRAVGTALSTNPFAPHVPCHRVIASDGGLGGFNGRTGHADCEVLRKAAMLRAEGVTVDVAGRVAVARWAVSIAVPGGVDAGEMHDGRLAAPLQ